MKTLLLFATVFILVTLCGLPDWEADIQTGVRAALAGDSPYVSERNFFTPPWGIVVLAPFAILPHPLDNVALTGAALTVYALVLPRKWYLLWPPIVLSLALGQLEFLVFAALLMPAWLGVVAHCIPRSLVPRIILARLPTTTL